MVADSARDAVVPGDAAGRPDEDSGRVTRAGSGGVGCELGCSGAGLNSRPVELLLDIKAGRAARGAAAAAAADGAVVVAQVGGVHCGGSGCRGVEICGWKMRERCRVYSKPTTVRWAKA